MSQEADLAFVKANALFVDENFDQALTHYSRAIELNPNNAEYFLKRSFCNYKLNKFTEAISDASVAIKLNPSEPLAYLRKGMAAFALEEFEVAKSAFTEGLNKDPQNTHFKTWLRKCEVELEDEQNNLMQVDTSAHSQTSAALTPRNEESLNSSPSPQQTSSSSSVTPSKREPAIRHDWYQTVSYIILSVFAKHCKKEDVSVHFEEQNLLVSIKLGKDNEYQLDIDLCDKIVPSESKYDILSTKIEIKLKKCSASNWPTLEATGKSVANWPSVTEEKKVGPQKNWDKIATELTKEDEEKLDGDAALNKLFQDIFGRGSDDQRRAMQKSYLESGGTVLSTNWDEVSKGPVKGSPPKGLEMKSWSED